MALSGHADHTLGWKGDSRVEQCEEGADNEHVGVLIESHLIGFGCVLFNEIWWKSGGKEETLQAQRRCLWPFMCESRKPLSSVSLRHSAKLRPRALQPDFQPYR